MSEENSVKAAEKKTRIKLTGPWLYLVNAAVFIAVCGIIIAVDQITKNVIYRNVFYGSSIVLIPGLLEISHVHNTGAAWGILNAHTGLLSAVTLIACSLLCFLYFEGRKKLFKASLLLVIGGAIGNLIDRIFRGFVIDFIKVWIFKYEFPNFNVADSCITIGCVLMIIAVIASGKTKEDTLFRKNSLLGRFFEKDRGKAKDKDKDKSAQKSVDNVSLEETVPPDEAGSEEAEGEKGSDTSAEDDGDD